MGARSGGRGLASNMPRSRFLQLMPRSRISQPQFIELIVDFFGKLLGAFLGRPQQDGGLGYN